MANATESRPSKSKSRVAVSKAAALLHGGDEKQVWADISSGELKATVLVEVDDGRFFDEPLRRTVARQFFAGKCEVQEDRAIEIPPAKSSNGFIVFMEGTSSHECVMRSSTVMVEVESEAVMGKQAARQAAKMRIEGLMAAVDPNGLLTWNRLYSHPDLQSDIRMAGYTADAFRKAMSTHFPRASAGGRPAKSSE